MKLSYRNQKNAEAVARHWNKPLDRPDWYEVKAQGDDSAEILIYDVIGWPFNDVNELVRAISGLRGKDILTRINSPGGDVFDSVALFNVLKGHSGKVTTRIESLAASSASFIALSGKEVQAYKNAMMMVHEPWALGMGNQYDFRELADILGKISGNMIDLYAEETNVGKREAKEMLKAETWMTAQEAKDKGFIDTILDSGKPVKAQFDLSVFDNLPDELRPDGKTEPTERDIEKALRDAGLSRNSAKAVLAGGWQRIGALEIDGVIESCKQTLAIIGGN